MKTLSEDARKRHARQKEKVLRELWRMGEGSSGQKLKKWHDILTERDQDSVGREIKEEEERIYTRYVRTF